VCSSIYITIKAQMHKISFLIFALAITHAFGQGGTCDDTFAQTLDITLTLTTAPVVGSPVTAASLNFCTSLGGTWPCCTATEINAFQTKLDTLVEDLEEKVIARDTAILAARKDIVALKTNITNFIAAAALAEENIEDWTTATGADLPSGVTNAQALEIQAFITDFGGIVAEMINSTTFATLREGFATYQEARATCFTELIKSQVAGWCAACAEDVSAWGVDVSGASPVVTYGSDFEERLVEACVPYFEASEEQSQILRASFYIDNIDDLTTALGLIADDDTTGVTDFLTVTAAPATIDEQPSEVPSGCDETACPFITSTVFVNGFLDQDALVLGGDVVTSRRRLQENRRRLQTNSEFNPPANEAKVTTIDFEANPGNLDNPNDLSALRVGVFSCIVAFFVALLI
jgi:hypothetical protein